MRRRPPRLPGRAGPGRRRRPGAARRDGGETAPEPAGKFAGRTRRNHTLVHALRAEGRGLREIARHLSWGLHTVQRYDRAATWQELVDGRWKAPRASKLDPFKPYLDQHAGQGHGSFTRLFREIRDLGYDGSYSVVRNYLDQIRPARTPLPQAPPTVRDVTNWLTRRPDSLTGDEKPRLTAILTAAPSCRQHRTRSAHSPACSPSSPARTCPSGSPMPATPGCPASRRSPRGLKQDLDAVTSGLTMPWSSGPVEGRVNHIKMIKRQMFGRAGLPLLRKRVPLTARS